MGFNDVMEDMAAHHKPKPDADIMDELLERLSKKKLHPEQCQGKLWQGIFAGI